MDSSLKVLMLLEQKLTFHTVIKILMVPIYQWTENCNIFCSVLICTSIDLFSSLLSYNKLIQALDLENIHKLFSKNALRTGHMSKLLIFGMHIQKPKYIYKTAVSNESLM